MNNKLLKRVLLIAIMILGVLSTTFVYGREINAEGKLIPSEMYYNYGENAYAHPYMRYENSIRGRLQIESLGGSAKYNEIVSNAPGSTVITVADLKEYYDILCREKGRALPGGGSTYLTDGSQTLPYSYPNLTSTDEGTTIDVKEGEEGHAWTNKSLARYLVGAKHRCTPKEAYILAEMIHNVAGGGGETGSDIVEIEFVAVSPDGSTREVEWDGTDDYGRDKYKYKDTGEDVPSNVEIQINENGINSGYSYVQYAWWATSYGHSGNTIPDTVFSKEADMFEEYIKDAATNQSEMNTYISMSPDSQDALSEDNNIIQKTFRTEEVEQDDGTVKTYNYAFDITYEPKWAEDIGDVNVGYDEETDEFTIGPLQLNYIEASAALNGREEVLFAGIIGMEVYTNTSEEPLERGKDWDFVWVSGDKRQVGDTYEFPHAGEQFYIRVKNEENLTKITNIKTHFKYMNASGECNRLNGTYNIGSWEQIKEEVGEDEDGNPIYDWYIECTDVQENNKSQNLTLGVKAARWYKYVDLDRDLEIQHGKIRIYKDVYDEEGNELSTGDWFKFTVRVDGASNSDEETIWVKAGRYANSKVYYWLKESGTPTYTVTEVESSAYFKRSAMRLIGIENPTGPLENESTVKVYARNVAKKYEGDLQVVKELKANHYTSQAVGGTFTFNVKIYTDSNLPFYVNGQRYTTENPYEGTIDVNVSVGSADEINSALSEKINVSWYGKEAPKYVVQEVSSSNPNITLDTSEKTGSLTKDTVVKTEPAVNKVEKEKAKLHIIKKLSCDDVANILDVFSKEYIESLKWNFTLKVDGHQDTEITLDTAKWQEDGSVIWESTTDYYYWSKGETKNYTITEHDNPEGTEFAGVEAGSDGSANGTSVTGTLKQNTDSKYEITNTIINKANNGKTTRIHITKNVESDEEITETQNFNFAVTLEGTFLYNGKLYKDARIQLTTDADGEHNDGSHVDKVENGVVELKDEETNNMYHFVVISVDSSKVGEWTSPEIKWYGEAPTFKVEERFLGENIQATVTPKEGTLVSDGNNFEIKAINYIKVEDEPVEGYLHIIKTVENADKLSADYLSKLKFVFDVEVTGYPKTTVTIDAEQKGNDWVWEWTSPAYTWYEKDGAPTYIVTEQESSDFNIISQNPQTGTLKKATVQELETNNGELITTDVEVVNQAKEHRGNLTIIKELEANSPIKDGGVTFNFDVEIKGDFTYNGVDYHASGENPEACKIPAQIILTSTKGEWNSDEIIWYGSEAPTYTVTENESNEATLISIQNAAGTIQEGSNKTIVTAINKSNEDEAYIEIVKQLDNEISGETFDDDFTFTIKVEGHEEETVTVKAGQTATFGPYKWESTSNPPTYEVTEINLPEGTNLVSITDNKSGTLAKDETVVIVAKNKYEEHEGNFNVKKEIVIDEKLLDLLDIQNLQFSVIAKVEGTFKCDGEVIENGSKTFEFTLTPDGEWTSPTIIWYGNNEPTVTVEETNLPKGWYNVGISNNGAILSTEGTTEIVVTNKIDIVNRMELTMELGGLVWEEWIDESSKNTEYSNPEGNNVYDAGLDYEKAGIEVYVYDKNGNLVTLYDDTDHGEVNQPLVTGSDGLWEARLKLDKIQLGYYVEFVYDGQTYKTVKPLVAGDASSYKNASDKSAWVNNSMASDKNRDEVNDRVATIEGYTPIEGNGNTTGNAISSNGESNLIEYTSTAVENESSRRISKVQTLNADGTAKGLYKTTASTLQVGLTYPFNKQISLLEVGGFTLTELGYEQYYIYTATQDYMKHINLGLVKRADADMGVTKDLVSAKVVVDDRLMEYTFNGLADLIAGDSNRVRTIQGQAMNLSYELGLYKTDYYYRADLYRILSSNGYQTLTEGFNAYSAVESFYKEFGNLDDTEMEVYLTYKMSLYNENSQAYDITIHKLLDYYDSSFELVTADEYRYITEKNNSAVEGHSELVASKTENNWVQESGTIKGSDGRTYKKMILNEDINLTDGAARELRVTFKVTKDTIQGVKDAIVLGSKANVIEIGSYSTTGKNGNLDGKIDCDSAPDNVNIEEYNTKTWYEDDTDSAPELELKLEGVERTLSGLAWEDSKEDNQSNGNGVYDKDKEALIGGLTTELIEKVEVNGKEYDFLWPTNEALAVFSGKTIQDITGFDSTIETARTETKDDNEEILIPVGGYEFTGIPTGNFVVRFVYGNDKTNLADTFGITGDAEALKEDGSSFSENREKILTAGYHKNAGLIDSITGKSDRFNEVVENVLDLNNVDTYTEVNTPAIYNGQDYKSTIYKVGGEHDSEARDDEARRLAVIAESETITNVNGTVLITANNVNDKHTKLYNNYWMFADTEKYSMPTVTVDGEQLVSKDNGKYSINLAKYEVKDVDFGLIERPENQIILDKEIKSIKLTTNDNKVIFDAEYDISYKLENNYSDTDIVLGMVGDKYIIAKATLSNTSIATDLMQALDKVENKLLFENNEDSIKNFRFINIDDTILQGTTIDIDYQITAINAGEQDYTIAAYEDLQGDNLAIKAKLLEDARTIKEAKINKSYEPGAYVSEFYYTGTPGANDVPVTVRVRQLIDYVDNDAVFTTAYNDGTDHSWRNTTVSEITGSGYDNERLLDIAITQTYQLVDINGMTYITEQRNNVILSEDSLENTDKNDLNIRNNGFEKKLSVIDISNGEITDANKSSITLSTSRIVAAAKDTDDLTFDNLVEIVKFENTVGRRDVTATPGNANPHLGEFETAIYETDSSATELVTFTPPTGLEVQSGMTFQVLLVVVIALGIVAIGVVIIKKKVL